MVADAALEGRAAEDQVQRVRRRLGTEETSVVMEAAAEVGLEHTSPTCCNDANKSHS